jgi:hemolysin III
LRREYEFASFQYSLWLLMSITHPSGLSCTVNRGIILATVLLSACGLMAFFVLLYVRPHLDVGASLVYGASLFACSLCSYLYNAKLFPSAITLLRRLDHAAIFLLIAGTYTPFLTKDVTGLFHISLMYWIWALAFTGIIMRLIVRQGYDRMFVGLYLLLGWSFVMALPQILRQTPEFPLVFLGLGAVFYSIGALIFAKDIGRWTDPVWHGFVLTAASLHFIAVWHLAVFSIPA